MILAIETSCDETAVALVKCSGGLKKPSFKVLENIVSSQIKIHRPFGGVVPNLAKREHIKNLPILYKKIAKCHKLSTISHIAVTVGPGLEPALWTGINFAQELAEKLKKPLIGVNHIEGHLYSNWLSNASSIKHQVSSIKFPAIALVVSGGHTILLFMKSATEWKKLGETLDDAAGESFDKVGRMLELPYPGGPEIEKLAKQGSLTTIKFPRPMLNKQNYDFSFSGLKTSVLYYLRDNPQASKNNVAASFQQAVIDVLMKKTIKAAKEFGTKSVMLSGGVSANKTLREALRRASEAAGKKFFAPSSKFNTDNAAMIAAAAYFDLLNKSRKWPEIKADSSLNI